MKLLRSAPGGEKNGNNRKELNVLSVNKKIIEYSVEISTQMITLPQMLGNIQ